MSSSPYSPPSIVSGSIDGSPNFSIRTFLSVVGPLLAMAVFNFWLGGQNFSSETWEITKWGVYIGEFAVLATWFSWSPDTILTRLATASVCNVLFSLSTWYGFSIAQPDIVRSYNHEFWQSFTVLPLSFLLACVPLLLLRRAGFVLSASCYSKSANNSALSVAILALFLSASLYAISNTDWLFWDLFTALLVAVVVGAFLLVCVPLVSIGLLRCRIHPIPLIIATVVFPLPAIAFATTMPVPAGGGGYYAIGEAATASLLPFLLLVVHVTVWRSAGIRTAGAESGRTKQ